MLHSNRTEIKVSAVLTGENSVKTNGKLIPSHFSILVGLASPPVLSLYIFGRKFKLNMY